MRRVVITGLGIVSCLGNDKATVTENLRNSRPGIRFNPEYKEMGLRSQVSGSIDLNLEELIDLDELACYVNVSRRQLERLFQKYLHCSPSRYYLKLRLIRARQLLKQTPMSIIEVASVCGFVSTPHFSKCYREFFGIPPRDERSGQQSAQVVALIPRPDDGNRTPATIAALQRAQGESTFASVRI
mgnify:CR=1 FL=1